MEEIVNALAFMFVMLIICSLITLAVVLINERRHTS